MLEQQLRQLSKFRFAITYPKLPGFILRLNFEPIILSHNIEGNYALLHWQAMPKGERRWGCFCMKDGETSYQSFIELNPVSGVTLRGIQIDETFFTFVPTAVIHCPNCFLSVDGDFGILKLIE
ncbi:MAG: hypothetical protein SFY66_18670 [Oculatellaceae cyanobacterium bins.114]|nr:hypothetical protein [Oculatellaceae cyanobacterium bins.114]